MLLAVGKHKARVVNYGIGRVAKGENQGMPFVQLQFAVEGSPENVFYKGYFTEKTKGQTLEELSYLGVTVQNLAGIADGPDGHVIDPKLVVEITVVHEEMKENNPPELLLPGQEPKAPKMFARVRYINPVGGRAFQELMDKKEFTYFVGSLGLQGEMMQRSGQTNKTPPRQQPVTPPVPVAQGIPTLADIPF